MNKVIWVLGAADPEMNMIEELLEQCGQQYVYAVAGGKRVHPGNAYRAENKVEILKSIGEEIFLVECGLADKTSEFLQLDHHRPGDFGYGKGPEDFLRASSIGQVVFYLAAWGLLPEPYVDSRPGISSSINDDGWDRGVPEPLTGWNRTPTTADPGTYGGTFDYWAPVGWVVCEDRGGDDKQWRKIPYEIVLSAAADHCLGAAYKGECPGIDEEELKHWRCKVRAAFQGRKVEDILKDMERAEEALSKAPYVTLLGVADMTHTEDHSWSNSVCDGCNRNEVRVRDMRANKPVPELPETATWLGESYLSGPLETPDGRKKITCSGSVEVIKAFLEHWAEDRLTDCYGDPARGFAEGYLTEE